jgi:hypothetical protein
MIDIHPPHHAATTRRDFFIHLATVVLGILIAIGLEQAVEYVHHRHQAAELRENLHAESQQIVGDTDRCIVTMQYRINWLNTRIDQVRQAVWHHQRLEKFLPFNPPYCAAPDMPIWRTAKESGLAFYLTKGEVTGYSEIEYVVTRQTDRTKQISVAASDTNQFLTTFPLLPDGLPDLSRASPEDLRHYLALLAAQNEGAAGLLSSLHQIRGAARAVREGETHLNAIYHAEHADQTADPLSRRSNHF